MKVYDKGGVRLYNADNKTLVSKIPDNKIDLVITSPPYDCLRSYSNNEDWCFRHFKLLAKELVRVLKEGGVIVWNVNDSTINGSKTGSSFRQALYFKDRCGLRIHDVMIYQKSNFSNPSKTRYHQVFEYVFILSKGSPKTFNPICDRPNIYAGKIGSFGKNTVTQVDGSKLERDRKVNNKFGMRHNVWLMRTAGQSQESKKYKHPAMFTEEFASDHIKSWSNRGDLVFDCFMGSGTVAVAAKKLKRKVIGCEISKDYVNIQLKRIKELK
jgi:site-specific DNA-methyltransferase (adenine-specific)